MWLVGRAGLAGGFECVGWFGWVVWSVGVCVAGRVGWSAWRGWLVVVVV